MGHTTPSIRTDTPASGKALRFLLMVLGIWILGRMIANGAFVPTATQVSLIQFLEENDLVANDIFHPPSSPPLAPSYVQYPSTEVISKAQRLVMPSQQLVAMQAGVAALSSELLAGHQLLLWRNNSAGFTTQRGPFGRNREIFALADFAPAAGVDRAEQASDTLRKRDRWAVDSWAFFRPSNGIQTIGGQAQYGGSQAGAIARYSPWRNPATPQFYLRATRALSGSPQSELAAGLSIRPSQRIPVRFAVEQRLAVEEGGNSRPSAYVVSEIPTQALPGETRISAYGQAGLVGVKEVAYFFDLQLVVEKPIIEDDGHDVAVGAGLWSGGQGSFESEQSSGIARVSRLDVGPRISARLPIAGQAAQLSLDWRQRVTGNAAPGSGPALTVSTHF